MPRNPINKGTAGTPSGDTVHAIIDKLEEQLDELYARPVGQDGKTVRHGTGAPGAGLGVDGDFYIDTTGNKTLYGPKTSGDWGSGTTLKGPQGEPGTPGADGDDGAQGPPGADGRTILSGIGTPNGSLGSNGDFYINTTGDELFGPKSGGAWGSGRSLVGPQGVKGDDGDPGDTGPQGDPGTPGADGKTVRSGSGAPGAGLGVDGDFYIDTTGDKAVYGPKSGGSWGSPTTMKGAQGDPGPQGDPGADGDPGPQGDPGAPGADGQMIRTGSGVPGAGLGNNGDYYIRTDNNTLIGPKAGGAWPGSGVSLVGPQGDPGADGDDGAPGSPGADGKTIRSGSGAPSGGLGVDGDFYIDTTGDKAIYGPKSGGSWGSPTTLKGAQGNAGAAGKTVLNGTAAPTGGVGVDGDFYIRTSDNTLYGPKASGSWPAPVSLVGPQGDAGTAGSDGADGNTILSGTGAPAGGLGVNGDFYIDTAAEELYGPKSGGSWGSSVSLVGPQGEQGLPGAGGTTVARLTADVTTSGTANQMTNISDLSFPVVAGQIYYFRAIIYYTSAATTGGSRWSINGPTAVMAYKSEYSLTTTTKTYNDGLTAYDQPAASNATSAVAAPAYNLAVIEGIVRPSASGTVTVRGAREVAGTAVVAKVDSFLEFKAI